MNLKTAQEMREVANESLFDGIGEILNRLETNVRRGKNRVDLDLYQVVPSELDPDTLKTCLEDLGYCVVYAKVGDYVEFSVWFD